VETVIKKFLTNEYVKSIFDIQPAVLKQKGIKGIITDLDNTLVPWNVKDATPEVIEWFKQMDEHDIEITIISNNKLERVKVFSEPLGKPYVYSARKPLRRSFQEVTKQMGLKKDEIVVIGDQVLKDVFGGNRAGLYTILVFSIVTNDDKINILNRLYVRFMIHTLLTQR